MITLTVRSRLPKGAIFYYEPELVPFRGTLIPNPEWIADDCITLERADGTISIIPRRDIVGDQPKMQGPVVQNFCMYGSRGDIYTLTVQNNLWSCTCRGFEFRKDCRHIRETKNQLERENS